MCQDVIVLNVVRLFFLLYACLCFCKLEPQKYFDATPLSGYSSPTSHPCMVCLGYTNNFVVFQRTLLYLKRVSSCFSTVLILLFSLSLRLKKVKNVIQHWGPVMIMLRLNDARPSKTCQMKWAWSCCCRLLGMGWGVRGETLRNKSQQKEV